MSVKFRTYEEARTQGFVNVREAKRKTGLILVDVSGFDSFCYAYELQDKHGNTVAESRSVWFGRELNKMGRLGCSMEMFDLTGINPANIA